MKLNEYGDKCFAVGEVVKVEGKKYRFKKIVPNASNPCALYAEGQARVTGFCGECGGCGGSFPDGTTRGHFVLVTKEAGAG